MGARRNGVQRAVAAVAAVLGVLLIGTSQAWSQAAPDTGFSNGTASASATAIKVNPTAAALSIGVTLGISLSGYTNDTAKAESRGIDLGIIGTTLAAEPCDGGDPTFAADRQPQPLTADSREPDAAQGKSASETFDKNPIPGFDKRVRATDEPLADATTVVVALGQAGALEIGGARTETTTRVVDKKTREAVATTEIGSLILGGGAVRIGSLKWQAIHRSGAENTKSGTFTVGSVLVGGVPLPVSGLDPAQLFATLNTVLKPFGVELRPPTSREVNGAIVVDPMAVAVVPSATRDSVAGQLLSSIQPLREQVVAALLQLDCSNATYVTVADIALGSLTGAGSFSLELGGVSASTGDVEVTHLLGDLGGGSTLIPGTPDEFIPGTEGVTTPGVEGTDAGPTVAGNRRSQPEVAAPIAAASDDGSRGGKLALLAGITLLLLALMAELDRRKMRSALKLSPTTEA